MKLAAVLVHYHTPDLLGSASEALRRFYLGHWRGHAAADLEAAWPIAARIAPANNLVRNTRLLTYFEPWELSSCESDRLYWARRFRESYVSPLASG